MAQVSKQLAPQTEQPLSPMEQLELAHASLMQAQRTYNLALAAVERDLTERTDVMANLEQARADALASVATLNPGKGVCQANHFHLLA